MQHYLTPTYFIDADHPDVVTYAKETVGAALNSREKAVALYLRVRDDFKYNPYRIDLRKPALKASNLLTRDYGYCVEKANLLAATARAVGIPSRLGFARVKNHLGTSRLETLLRTDTLVFHGYTEFYLDEQWVKATPAFNKALCERLHVPPLAFDGENDSIFQQHTDGGEQYMEYLHDYGQFADLPFELYLSELEKHYPHIFATKEYKTEEFWFIR